MPEGKSKFTYRIPAGKSKFTCKILRKPRNLTKQQISKVSLEELLLINNHEVHLAVDDDMKKASTIIHEKLAKTPKTENFCYIYKVYDHLRNLNKAAYEPQLVAIGPYHHGTPNTKHMEKVKLLYLNSLCIRTTKNVDDYLSAIWERAQTAHICYGNLVVSDSIDFINMMLLDGCFIIELLLKYEAKQHDDIIGTDWKLESIQRDLMLFENQIPFFVLSDLFTLVQNSSDDQRLLKLSFEFFQDIIPDSVGYRIQNIKATDIIFHLLDLIYLSWRPLLPHQRKNINGGVKSITSATKLRDANVDFEKNGQDASLFDVKFENGILKVTPLRIEDTTEALFRNLIAYEQYFPGERYFITDYVKFLDCLIDSPEDVEILRENEVVENWLGTDKVVSDIFIKFTDSIFIPNSSYVEVFDQVNKHCKKKRNKWMAMLRRNHLSSPWAILSIIAAVILLLLTTVQTVCSILQL